MNGRRNELVPLGDTSRRKGTPRILSLGLFLSTVEVEWTDLLVSDMLNLLELEN